MFYVILSIYLVIGVVLSNIHSLGVSDVEKNKVLKEALYSFYIVFLWPVDLLVRGFKTLLPDDKNDGNSEAKESEEEKHEKDPQVSNEQGEKEEELNHRDIMYEDLLKKVNEKKEREAEKTKEEKGDDNEREIIGEEKNEDEEWNEWEQEKTKKEPELNSFPSKNNQNGKGKSVEATTNKNKIKVGNEYFTPKELFQRHNNKEKRSPFPIHWLLDEKYGVTRDHWRQINDKFELDKGHRIYSTTHLGKVCAENPETGSIKYQIGSGFNPINPEKSTPVISMNFINDSGEPDRKQIHLTKIMATTYIRTPRSNKEYCRRLDNTVNDFSVHNIAIFDRTTGKCVAKYEGNNGATSKSNGRSKSNMGGYKWRTNDLTSATFEILNDEDSKEGISLNSLVSKVSEKTGYDENEPGLKSRISAILTNNHSKGNVKRVSHGHWRLVKIPKEVVLN